MRRPRQFAQEPPRPRARQGRRCGAPRLQPRDRADRARGARFARPIRRRVVFSICRESLPHRRCVPREARLRPVAGPLASPASDRLQPAPEGWARPQFGDDSTWLENWHRSRPGFWQAETRLRPVALATDRRLPFVRKRSQQVMVSRRPAHLAAMTTPSVAGRRSNSPFPATSTASQCSRRPQSIRSCAFAYQPGRGLIRRFTLDADPVRRGHVRGARSRGLRSVDVTHGSVVVRRLGSTSARPRRRPPCDSPWRRRRRPRVRAARSVLSCRDEIALATGQPAATPRSEPASAVAARRLRGRASRP